MGDALRRRQVVLRRRRGGRDLLVLECVEQVLAAVLLVAVLDDGPQGLGPGHLRGRRTILEKSHGDGDISNAEMSRTFKRMNWAQTRQLRVVLTH